MIVFVWAARTGDSRELRSGVTDDQVRARRAAEACIRAGLARTASIEVAVSAVNASSLDLCYQLTGDGWYTHEASDGDIVWVRTPASAPNPGIVPTLDLRIGISRDQPH